MSISIKNLTKVYGEQKALDNINIEIEQGQIVGLLGPNGAGKSTMMKILTCFIPPTEGEVKVCGYDIFDNPMQVRANIGYLPEQNPLYYDMYVREFLDFIAGIHKIDKKIRKQRVEEMIELTGISKEVNKKISMLSKGYKQRVGIAQALIHDPKVLILDEPTKGIDVGAKYSIYEIMNELATNGYAIIMVSSEMPEVLGMADRVVVMRNGRVSGIMENKELTQEMILEHSLKSAEGGEA